MCLFVDRPAAKESGYYESSEKPEPNWRVHSVDSDQGDEDGAAGASKDIGDEEAAWRDSGEPGDITHQVAGKDGQDETEEIEKDALMTGDLVPFVDDFRRCEFVDQVASIAASDDESDLTP